jgi:hypothetical protein
MDIRGVTNRYQILNFIFGNFQKDFLLVVFEMFYFTFDSEEADNRGDINDKINFDTSLELFLASHAATPVGLFGTHIGA